MHKDVSVALRRGIEVFYDATDVCPKNRSEIIRLGKLFGYHIIAYVMNTPLHICLARNSQRERFVPIEVIMKMVNRFVFPHYSEGFDEIILHYNNDVSDIRPLQYKMDGFDQLNSHHPYSLGEHCKRVASHFNKEDSRYMAGLVHDVGKMFTQSIGEDGQAHYYCHANHSSYYICSHPGLIGANYDFVDVMFYITYHMHIRDILKSEKAMNKYLKLWGEDRFNKLVEFMNADNDASGTK